MRTHGELGPGFLEAVYREALAVEMREQGIPHGAEVALPIWFRGRRLQTSYRADFVCYGSILVEVKALRHLSGVESAQVLNYLRAGRLSRGLLMNFGASSLQIRRFVL